ncbi:cysteine-rich repeat secretory 12-like [Olea europaea subsp. europaea]|uniref:Cysteine-rich repeat secretory 12-like n=2 Tax=Olea europaea subsp. europaea TaxID=158383 RepID=A0A8S0PPI4_OLEEU|nr:cysteine-rich repeat secretory 12-like [Olea europaea subsp. europaea]
MLRLTYIVSVSHTLKKMKFHALALSFSSVLCYLLAFSLFPHSSYSALESFVYAGCTQFQYNDGSTYESNLNSVLASIANSASLCNFNNFKISLPGSTESDIVYGLYQCRGDLASSDCHNCVTYAVSRLGKICYDTSGGTLQLEGCFVKYDNISFLGAVDKTVVLKKCGQSSGYDSDFLTRRDAVQAYLTGAGQYFRVGGSGKVQGMAQCVQDLSMGQCQDCLSEAIQQLKNECGSSSWGDMFLAKCYARYSVRGFSSDGGRQFRRRGWWFMICGFIVSLIFGMLD